MTQLKRGPGTTLGLDRLDLELLTRSPPVRSFLNIVLAATGALRVARVARSLSLREERETVKSALERSSRTLWDFPSRSCVSRCMETKK